MRRRLGSGGFATVWLAHDEQLDAEVAIKVLADNWAHDDSVRQRFLEEGRFLRRVESEHVVQVHDVGELEDGRPFLVLTYADRGTLADRLKKEPLAADRAVGVVVQVGRGLQALHRRGLLHRDVKPANVLFRSTDDGERAVLSDLGLGKSLDEVSRITMPGGTPSYVAPEQAMGERLDQRADLYSLGAVAYAALTGRSPHQLDGLGAAGRVAAPPPPSSLGFAVPDRVDAAIVRALDPDREKRWPDVQSFARELVGGLDETTQGYKLVGTSGRGRPDGTGDAPVDGPTVNAEPPTVVVDPTSTPVDDDDTPADLERAPTIIIPADGSNVRPSDPRTQQADGPNVAPSDPGTQQADGPNVVPGDPRTQQAADPAAGSAPAGSAAAGSAAAAAAAPTVASATDAAPAVASPEAASASPGAAAGAAAAIAAARPSAPDADARVSGTGTPAREGATPAGEPTGEGEPVNRPAGVRNPVDDQAEVRRAEAHRADARGADDRRSATQLVEQRVDDRNAVARTADDRQATDHQTGSHQTGSQQTGSQQTGSQQTGSQQVGREPGQSGRTRRLVALVVAILVVLLLFAALGFSVHRYGQSNLGVKVDPSAAALLLESGPEHRRTDPHRFLD